MYSLAGTLGNEQVDVLWDDGYVDGSPSLMDLINLHLELEPDQTWGPPGGPLFSGKNVLKDGAAFYSLVAYLVPGVEVIDGMPPPLTEVPEGCIP